MFSFNQTKQLIILIVIAVLVIGAGLFFRGRSTGKWVCKDNLWVAVGKPDTKKPGLYCK